MSLRSCTVRNAVRVALTIAAATGWLGGASMVEGHAASLAVNGGIIQSWTMPYSCSDQEARDAKHDSDAPGGDKPGDDSCGSGKPKPKPKPKPDPKPAG